MERKINSNGKTFRFRIIQADITDQSIDAIINVANKDLILGSGVARVIRKKGGPMIQKKECNKIGGIPIYFTSKELITNSNLFV